MENETVILSRSSHELLGANSPENDENRNRRIDFPLEQSVMKEMNHRHHIHY